MKWYWGDWSDEAERKAGAVVIALFVAYLCYHVVRALGTARGWW